MSAANGTALRTVAFGDVEGRLWGAALTADPARAATVVIGGIDRAATVLEPTLSVDGRDWILAGAGIELRVAPRGEPAEADGDGRAEAEISGLQELCDVRGQVDLGAGEQAVEWTGTRSEIVGLDPAVIASARAVSGWFGPDEALTVVSLRARRASEHQSDLVAATLFDPGGWVPVSDPRLSTTYTQAGDPVRASLELWVTDGENEFPRRAAGEASAPPVAASTDGLDLRVAPLRCHSRGLEGAGVYVLATL